MVDYSTANKVVIAVEGSAFRVNTRVNRKTSRLTQLSVLEKTNTCKYHSQVMLLTVLN